MERQQLKQYLKAHPRLYKLYTNLRHRQLARVRNWVLGNQRFMQEHHLSCFVFYQDKAYVRVFEDVEFFYSPELFGGLLGLETDTGFETQEVRHVLTRLHDSDVVLDIGASFGLYSVVIGKKLPGVTVHAFEPVSSTFKLLQHNIEHNNVAEHIVLNQCAVADREGSMDITTDEHAGNHLTTKNGVVASPAAHVAAEQVPVTTVDAYVVQRHLSRIHLIKCDIEGAELLMLHGARATIERDHPDLFLEIAGEWTGRFGHEAKDVLEYVLRLGYTYTLFAKDGSVHAPSQNTADDLRRGYNFYLHFPAPVHPQRS